MPNSQPNSAKKERGEIRGGGGKTIFYFSGNLSLGVIMTGHGCPLGLTKAEGQ